MKAGVVTKDAGVWVNGKKGGEYLAAEKQKRREEEWSAPARPALFFQALQDKAGENKGRTGVDDQHFVELKEFIGGRTKHEGRDGQEEVKKKNRHAAHTARVTNLTHLYNGEDEYGRNISID